MPVHPALQPFLDATAGAPAPPVDPAERIATLRVGVSTFGRLGAGEPETLQSVDDHAVAGPHGPIPVRVYTPVGGGNGSGALYLHGGGWISGSVDAWDSVCRRIAAASGAVVASVDYRLAPEYPFPAPLEECHAALTWFVARAADFGVDPGRVAVVGDSAGANLGAAVALTARDAGPTLRAQVLVYPVTDATCTSGSMAENAQGYFLTADAMREMWALYLGGWARDVGPEAADARASVLHAPDLTGLPPALVLTAEFDPLRDEGEAFAARLADADVPVVVHRFDGMIHGFLSMREIVPASDEAVGMIAAFLHDHV
ncbi:MAG: alpha/beta hydrolase [Actinomycetes bacterium]